MQRDHHPAIFPTEKTCSGPVPRQARLIATKALHISASEPLENRNKHHLQVRNCQRLASGERVKLQRDYRPAVRSARPLVFGGNVHDDVLTPARWLHGTLVHVSTT